MIKDYFFFLCRSTQKDTQELSMILLVCLTTYSKMDETPIGIEKNTAFDILDVVDNFSMSHIHVEWGKN